MFQSSSFNGIENFTGLCQTIQRHAKAANVSFIISFEDGSFVVDEWECSYYELADVAAVLESAAPTNVRQLDAAMESL